MKNLIYTDSIIKRAFTASAIVAGAAGAITGAGAVAFDTGPTATATALRAAESAVLQNMSAGGVLYDVTDVTFLCTANLTANSITFQVFESDSATITSGRLATGTAVAGALVTIPFASEHLVGIIRLRLDRSTVTKRYIAISAVATTTDAVEATVIAVFNIGSGQATVTQDLAAVSVE